MKKQLKKLSIKISKKSLLFKQLTEPYRLAQSLKKQSRKSNKDLIEAFCAEHPLLLTFLIITCISLIFIPITYINHFYDNEFFKGLLENVHVLIFDLIVVGVIGLFFSNLGQRQNTIKRYREEIDDFLGWKANEAKFHIIGNIKRLNRLGVSDINLERAYLNNANLMDINLQGANLRYAHLQGAKMWNTHLEGANLNGAHMENAELFQANLGYANLIRTHLEKADLNGAILWYVKLDYSHLEGTKLWNTEFYSETDPEGITYDDNTVWPLGFTPSTKK